MNQWDKYFLDICNAVASNSKCFSRKIGAILVRDNIVIATGYNGPPRDMPRCDKRWEDSHDPIVNTLFAGGYKEGELSDVEGRCPRQLLGFDSGERLDLCPAVHAEVNCVTAAARNGVSVKGARLYMNAQIPCSNCMGVLVNAGVSTVVITDLAPYNQLTAIILKHADIIVRTFDGDSYD